MVMSRDEIKFSRRYFEAIDNLPTSEQSTTYKAIFDFLFNFKNTELSGISKSVFDLIKPELKRSNQNYLNANKKVASISLLAKRKPTAKRNESQPPSATKAKKQIFEPPTLIEVISYFEEKGYTKTSAEKAFNYYDVANWKDSKANQVKNWKQKMQGVWFKEENLKSNTNGKQNIAISQARRR